MGGFSEIEEAQADFKACLAKLLVLYAGETVARSCTAPCGAKSSGEEEDPKAWGLFSRRRDAAAAAFAGANGAAAERWELDFTNAVAEQLGLDPKETSSLDHLLEAMTHSNHDVVSLVEHGSDVVLLGTFGSLGDALAERLRKEGALPRPTWVALVMRSLITAQVKRKSYDARVRAVYKRVVKALGCGVTWRQICRVESGLAWSQRELLLDGDADPAHNGSNGGRVVQVALAALSGGALLMYAGAIAAPSIAASLLALTTGTIGQLSSAVLSYWGVNLSLTGWWTSTSAISTVFGATGAGLTGYKMSKRIRGVTEFHFVPLHSDFPLDRPESLFHNTAACSGLPVFVCVPGWVEEGVDPRRVWGGGHDSRNVCSSDDEATVVEGGFELMDDNSSRVSTKMDEDGWSTLAKAAGEEVVNEDLLVASWEALEVGAGGWWRELVPGGEEHVLVWESAFLRELHKVMNGVLHEASHYVLDEVLKQTFLHGVTTAAALPMTFLNALSKLDNPWTLALERSKEAGQILADVLVSRPQGARPVTLLGYSMGARLIFHCLEALHMKGPVGQGIIENVVLLGAPIGNSLDRWSKARSVVAGRLINGYSYRDWILKYLFRSKTWKVSIAGITPVDHPGVENLDLTDMVNGHMAYPSALPDIMNMLGLED